MAPVQDGHGAHPGPSPPALASTALTHSPSPSCPQVLHDLRRPEIIFPPTWDKVKLARHTKIVQACLTHNPELRPSPKDLLSSDLLPPRVGDDSIEETIRLLSQSGTTHAQTLISALFNQSDEDRMRKDYSYDFYDGQGVRPLLIAVIVVERAT